MPGPPYKYISGLILRHMEEQGFAGSAIWVYFWSNSQVHGGTGVCRAQGEEGEGGDGEEEPGER